MSENNNDANDEDTSNDLQAKHLAAALQRQQAEDQRKAEEEQDLGMYNRHSNRHDNIYIDMMFP